MRDWQAQPPPVAALTIGNFDGVHRGHQALLNKCRALADGQPVGVVSFDPLPIEVLFPERAQGRVTSTRQRIHELAEYGADVLWLLRFNQALAQQSPDSFIQRVLVDGLAVQHVVVGDDFRFGHRRAGTIASLRAAGALYGFEVHTQKTIADQHERISSTRLRHALSAGDVSAAGDMLGRPYALQGRVIRGQQLGRKLGFPTINIDVSGWPCLLTGVFAVRLELEAVELRHKTTHNHPFAGRLWDGVASIGYRPSVTDTVSHNRHLLEAHIFDWSGDLYGQRIRVNFIRQLRAEQEFSDLSLLIEQMQQDARQARALLKDY